MNVTLPFAMSAGSGHGAVSKNVNKMELYMIINIQDTYATLIHMENLIGLGSLTLAPRLIVVDLSFGHSVSASVYNNLCKRQMLLISNLIVKDEDHNLYALMVCFGVRSTGLHICIIYGGGGWYQNGCG